MKISVLVEPHAACGYRARCGEPLPMTAEGTTRENALQNLRKMIEKGLSNGKELLQLDMEPYEHPFAKYAGTWSPDDPVIRRWKELVEEYRCERDEETDF